jgi:hypothetical protein
MAHFECIDVSWECAESVGFCSGAADAEFGNALFCLDFERFCATFVSEAFVVQEGATSGSIPAASTNY